MPPPIPPSQLNAHNNGSSLASSLQRPRTIKQTPQVNCRTDEYLDAEIYMAWPAFLLLVVGIPVYIFVILHTAVLGHPLCGVRPSAYLRDRISVSINANIIVSIQIFTCHT